MAGSSLLSLERFNSAGSHSSLTHTENLVCGILDFGNSSNWMARSWMQLVQQRFARKTSEKDASIGGGRETRSSSRVQFFSIHPFSPSLSMIFFLFFFRFPTISGVAVARCNLGWVVKILTLCGPRQFIRVLASRSFKDNRHWIFIDGFPRNIDGSPVPMESVNFTPLWFHVWQIISTMIGFVERSASNI